MKSIIFIYTFALIYVPSGALEDFNEEVKLYPEIADNYRNRAMVKTILTGYKMQ